MRCCALRGVLQLRAPGRAVALTRGAALPLYAGAPRGSSGGGSPTASGTARTRAVFGPAQGGAAGSSAEGARARPPTPPKDAAELRRRIADVSSAPGEAADAAAAPGSPQRAGLQLPPVLKRKAGDALSAPAAKAHRRAGAGIAMLLRAAAALDGGVAAPQAQQVALQAVHAAHAHAAYAAMLAGAAPQQQPLTPPHAMPLGDGGAFGAQTAALLAALRPHVEARAAARQQEPQPAGFCAATLAAALQQSLDVAAAQAKAQAAAQASAQAAAASTVAALLAALPAQAGAGGAHLELLRSLLGAAAQQAPPPPPPQQPHASLLAALFAAQQQQPAAAM